MAGPVDPKAADTTQSVKASADTTKAFNDQLKIIIQMRDVMNQLVDSMSRLCSSPCEVMSPERIRELTKEAEHNASVMQAQAEVIKKYTKIAKYATAGITGLGQGFKNLVALGKGVFNLFVSVADGLWSVTKAVIAIPFKLMEGLFKMANKGGDTAYAQALEDIRKQYGSLQSDASMAIKGAAAGMKTLELGGISTYRIFGNAAERLVAVTKMVQGMGAAFQVFQAEVKNNGAAMAAYNKGLGITDDMMGGIASNAMRMGKGITQIQNDMTKQSLGMAKAFGVNAKVISHDMGNAMKDLAHFGHLSTSELAIAATFANKLGVSVDKLTGIMDATSTYDQAAEGMSKLNEQYGTNIDATEIMSAQNPADALAILRKEFAKTGKDMSSLTRQDRMLIKSSAGLTDELMDAAFSAKNANVSLSDIRLQGEKNAKKTMTQAEAMNKLADSMERLIKTGQVEGGIFAHFMHGMKRGLETSPEFMKLMNNIRQVFLVAIEAGMKLGRMFVDLFPGVKDVFVGLGKLFEPARWKTMFAEVTKAFDVFRVGGSGKIEDFVERIKSIFSKFLGGGAGGSQQVIEGYKKFGKAVFGILVAAGALVWKKMKELYTEFISDLDKPNTTANKIKNFFKEVIVSLSTWITKEAVPFAANAIALFTDWLKPAAIRKGVGSSLEGLKGTMAEIFGPLGTALFKAGETLVPLLADLAVRLMISFKEAMIGAIVTIWKNISWQEALGLALITIGPAIGNIILVAATNYIGGKMFAAGTAFFAKKAAEQLAVAAAEKLATELAAKSLITAGVEAAITGTGAATGAALTTAAAAPAVAAGAATGAGFVAAIGAAIVAGGPLIVATAVAGLLAILSGIFVAFDNAVESTVESDFRQDSQAKINKLIDDKSKSTQEKIDGIIADKKKLEDRLKESKGFGFINWIAGGDSEAEKNLAATMAARDVQIEQVKASDKKIIDAEEARKKSIETQLSALGPVTIDTAEARFKKVEELAKTIMGKGFNIDTQLQTIKKKMDGIQWSIIDPEQEKKMNEVFLQMDKIHGVFVNLADIGGLIAVATQKMGPLMKADVAIMFTRVKESFVNAIDAVTDPKYAARVDDAFDKAPKIKTVFASISDVAGSLQSLIKNMTSIDSATVSDKTIIMGSAIKQVIAAMLLPEHGPAGTVKRTDVATAKATGEKLVEMFDQAGKVSGSIQGFVNETGKYTEAIVTTSITKTQTTITQMVGAVQKMDDALSKLGTINIGTRLDSVAKSLGIGSSGTYTVESKQVVININFAIQMDAGKVEKAMLMNTESIIKDRINFALGGGGGKDAKVSESLMPNMSYLPVSTSTK